MTPDTAVELARNAIFMTLILGTPVMVVAIAVGLLISILQAVTQVQEQTLSFAPKIVVMMLVILFTLPWALSRMMEYSTQLIQEIPGTF